MKKTMPTTEFEPRSGPTLWVQTECANCDCPPSRVAWLATPCPDHIIGTVSDARSGEPLEDIAVSVEGYETGSFGEDTTDGLGHYRIGPLEAGAGYVLTVSGPGYSYLLLEDGVLPPQGLVQNVALVRTGVVQGSVSNEAGQPIQGVALSFSQLDEPAQSEDETQTNADGKFCICSLDASSSANLNGSSYQIVATHPAYSYFEATLFVSPRYLSSDEVKFNGVMVERATITGSVTVEGMGQAGVRVVVVENVTGLLLGTQEVVTDASGFFSLSVDAPHTYRLMAQGQGTSTAEIEVSVTPGQSTAVPTVMLDGPGSIAGIVTDLAGNPVAGATVEVRDVGGTSPMAEPVTTSTSGAYTFVQLRPDQQYFVCVLISGAEVYTQFPSADAIDVLSGQTTLINLQGDTVGPTGQINQPANSTTISDIVAVIVEAEDNQAIDSIGLFVDDVEVETIYVSDYDDPAFWTQQTTVTFTWDSATVENGTHTLSAHINDLTGNRFVDSVIVMISNSL